MSLLSREQILQAEDLGFEDVEVPEWGGTVRVRIMTGAERDAFEQSIVTRRGKDVNLNMVNIRAKLVATCLIDEKGDRLFTEKDVNILAQKSAVALDRVFGVAQRLNGLTEADVNELAVNFQPAPNGASTSD